MSKTLAIKDHKGLCWNCLKTKDNIRRIVIPEMGYGGGFDGCGTEVHLCEECYQKSNPKIWGLNVIKEDYCEEYEFEDVMRIQNKILQEYRTSCRYRHLQGSLIMLP